MEAARSDAPDAFQGLFAALEDACRAKRLSVDGGVEINNVASIA